MQNVFCIKKNYNIIKKKIYEAYIILKEMPNISKQNMDF